VKQLKDQPKCTTLPSPDPNDSSHGHSVASILGLGCESTHPGIVKRVLNTIDYHQPTPAAAGNDPAMEVENGPPIYPHSATPAPAFSPVKRSAKKPAASRKAHSARRTPTKASISSKKSGGMRSSSGVTHVGYSGPLDSSHLSLGTKPPPPGVSSGSPNSGSPNLLLQTCLGGATLLLPPTISHPSSGLNLLLQTCLGGPTLTISHPCSPLPHAPMMHMNLMV